MYLFLLQCGSGNSDQGSRMIAEISGNSFFLGDKPFF